MIESNFGQWVILQFYQQEAGTIGSLITTEPFRTLDYCILTMDSRMTLG